MYNGHEDDCMSQSPDGGPCTCPTNNRERNEKRQIGLSERLYAVVTLAKDAAHGGERTPAVCTTLQRAKQIIETNEGDIWEHSYMFALISEFTPDVLYDYSGKQYWYEWDLTQKRYILTNCPEQYKDYTGFGI